MPPGVAAPYRAFSRSRSSGRIPTRPSSAAASSASADTIQASSLEQVVAEIAATRITERGETRADDRVTEAAMEDRKREGYF